MAVVVNVVGKFDDKDIEKARRALDGLGSTAKTTSAKASTGFRQMGAVAAVAAAAIATRFGVDSVRAFAEAEEAQKRLQFAFDKFPAMASTSIDALRELNSEWQKKTKFDDDAIASGQAVLAQFKLTGAQLRDVTPLLLDYASATGKDVNSAAQDFGKALLGNAKALKNVGIFYKSTGDSAKDFANITQLMRDKVGGFAEKEGATTVGQLAILENQFGELQEQVGEALVPALRALVDVGKPIVSTFGALPVPVRTVGIAVTVLGTAAVVAVPKVVALNKSLLAAGPAGAKAAAGMKAAGKAAGVLGAAMAAAAVVDAFSQSEVNAAQSAETLAKNLQALASGSGGVADVGVGFQTFTGRAVELDEALGLVRDNHWWDQLEGALAGFMNVPANFNLAKESVAGLDSALTQMVGDGNAEAAALALKQMGIGAEEAKTLLPQYSQALTNAEQPTKDFTRNTQLQASALDAVTSAFKRLQGILDKGAAKDQWQSALNGIGAAAKDAKGKLLGPSDAAIALRDNLRGSIGDLMAYAETMKNPAKRAKAVEDGIAGIRASLIKNGIKPADADKFLAPFMTVADKARTEAEQVGRFIAVGLTSGIVKNKATAIAEATNLGKAAVQAVRRGASVASPSKYTYWVGTQVVAGLTKGVVDKSGGAKKVIADATREALSGAQDVVERWRQKGRDAMSFIDGVRSQVRDFGSVAGFQSERGTLSGPTTAGDVTGQMRARVQQAKQFAKDVAALRKAKLNNASLQEIISAGPVAGGEIARALLAGGASAIAEVNGLEAQLNRAAASIGDTAGQSQYGMNRAQAQGLARTNVRIEKGAIVVTVGAGTKASDAKAIESAVDKALDKAVNRIIRELSS